MLLPLVQRHPRYTIASGVGFLTLLLLLASKHEAFPGSGGFLGPPHHGPPPGFDVEPHGSVGARVADAEQDYDIFVGRRNALIREMGTDPTKVDAYVTLIAVRVNSRRVELTFSMQMASTFSEIPHAYPLYVNVFHHYQASHLIVAHAFLGDFFLPAFRCPHKVKRVGTLGDGGKWVCGLEKVAEQRKCVIYSVGTRNLGFSLSNLHR